MAARQRWLAGRTGLIAGALRSQTVAAAVTPRAERIAELIDLQPGKRYLDVGCGTGPYAHLLAQRAGLTAPPVCLDLVAADGTADAEAWPEQLPLADNSFDAITSLYYIRRFDDDVVHLFAHEISRVLAPGGAALVMDVAPVRAPWLDAIHRKVVGMDCEEADLRGWARLAALFTECGFDEFNLVPVGPFLFPPIPRIAVQLRLRAIEETDVPSL